MTAPADDEDRLIGEALAWHEALAADDGDWDGYTAWLEADPRHREIFDSVALTTATVDGHRAELVRLLAAQESIERPRIGKRRSMLVGGAMAVAAALALVVVLPIVNSPETVATYSADARGSRSLALADGIQITLAPSSMIVVHGKNAARIELARGEAYFDVRHDPARLLTVAAGNYRISDIGTRFAVNISGGAFRVGVSEGTVSVGSSTAGGAVEVNAGQQAISGSAGLSLASVATQDVASWRNGRLSYADAPLSLVAGDISRYSGVPVSIDPSLEKSHFSGTLVIGDGTRLLPDLAAIMGVHVDRDARGAHIGPSAR